MDARVIDFQPWAERTRVPGFILILALSVWALAAMLFLPLAIATAALAASALLIMFARLTWQRSEWRLFALLLIVEVLPSANFLPLSEAQRPLLRYPLYLLFCVPVLPALWRSGMLRRGGFRLYAIYFAWAVLSAAWSLVPMFSLGRALGSVLLFAALCSVAADVMDDEALARMLRYVLLACAVLTAILAATSLIPGFPGAWFQDPELGAARLQGIFDSPNQAGEVNMITIGAALACWDSLSRRLRIGAAILIAASILMMIAADSRSPAVAGALSVAALVIWRFRWRGAAAVIAAGVLGVFIAAQLDPQALLYVTRNDVTTLTGRTTVMNFSIQRIADHPLLGYGFGVEGQIFQNRYFPSWDDLWGHGPRIPIHNGYLSRAVGLGLPAAILWLFAFLRPFAALFAPRDDSSGFKKRVVLLLVLPVLILYLSETLGGDCRYPAGVVTVFIWAAIENWRLRGLELARSHAASGWWTGSQQAARGAS